MNGLRAACLPRYSCRNALVSGKLVELFGEDGTWTAHAGQRYALLPTRRGNSLNLHCLASKKRFDAEISVAISAPGIMSFNL